MAVVFVRSISIVSWRTRTQNLCAQVLWNTRSLTPTLIYIELEVEGEPVYQARSLIYLSIDISPKVGIEDLEQQNHQNPHNINNNM